MGIWLGGEYVDLVGGVVGAVIVVVGSAAIPTPEVLSEFDELMFIPSIASVMSGIGRTASEDSLGSGKDASGDIEGGVTVVVEG